MFVGFSDIGDNQVFAGGQAKDTLVDFGDFTQAGQPSDFFSVFDAPG